MLDRAAPFVLLDDARPSGGGATLYQRPGAIIETRDPAAVPAALERLRAATAAGRHAAGYLSYEAGAALEPKLARRARTPAPGAPPLLWFGLFDHATRLDPEALATLLGDPAGAHAGQPRPAVARPDYAARVARILALIAAGDIYQANLTFAATVPVAGDPVALYARLRRQGGGWGGVVFTGRHWLLSASPELFFTLADGVATARPMKGTAPRHTDPAMLAADPKQRAENLMIVDLMRNDLARVAIPGGVAVPALFTVETYPTVHHLSSTVTARLAPGRDAIDLIAALFPCGSITGAPKIRAMEVIDDTEAAPRGPYTGGIGHIGPGGGEAAFNVAIRTLVVADGADRATLGLGSAIVADSDPAGEWEECLVKAAFVTDGARPFDLIETLRFEAVEGFIELERHLARMKASADALGFAFDRHRVRNELQAASFPVRTDALVRLRLGMSGGVAIEMRPLPATPETPAVRLVCRPVAAGDFRLRHKTSDRAFYDDARRAAGTFEVVFIDADGHVTEGSFTNLFVERDGVLLTPPLSRGLIPGTLRQRLIDEGRAREQDIPADALNDGFLLGNAVRGLFSVTLVA